MKHYLLVAVLLVGCEASNQEDKIEPLTMAAPETQEQAPVTVPQPVDLTPIMEEIQAISQDLDDLRDEVNKKSEKEEEQLAPEQPAPEQPAPERRNRDYGEIEGLAEALEALAKAEDYRVVEVTQDSCPECMPSYRALNPYFQSMGLQPTEWNMTKRGRWKKGRPILSTPTWVLLKGTKEVGRVEGNFPDRVRSMIDNVQSSLPKVIPVPSIKVKRYVPGEGFSFGPVGIDIPPGFDWTASVKDNVVELKFTVKPSVTVYGKSLLKLDGLQLASTWVVLQLTSLPDLRAAIDWEAK